MFFVAFFKNVLFTWKHSFAQLFQLTKIQRQNSSCIFHLGSQFENVKFGNSCVVFNNVLMANSDVGSHTYIQKKSRIFNASIGKFCSIGSNVSIGPGKHKLDGISLHPAFYLKNTPLAKTFADKDLYIPYSKTIIGNDVWIGENVVVLDGVQIGNGAVLAAGAIVTENVPNYAIVGGVPAKIIKMRFDQDTIKAILASEWWNLSDDQLYQKKHLFFDLSKFLNLNWIEIKKHIK